jgi:hypothetical protein
MNTTDIFTMTEEEFRAHNARLAQQDAAWGAVLRRSHRALLEGAGPLGADPDEDGQKAAKARRRLPRVRTRNV